MTGILKDLVRAVRAERLKLKGTLALWLAAIAPAVVLAVEALAIYGRREYYLNRGLADAWGDLAMQTMVLWCLVMLPLFVALETALVAQLEHGNQQWKHLCALPISRGALYTAKQLGGMALIGISLVMLVAFTLICGVMLRFLIPNIGFEASPPLGEIGEFAAFVFLASWLMISIQTWVAQRWSSFVVASAVGVAMTTIGVIVIQSRYAGYYPWTLPILVANGFSEYIHPLNVLAEGVRPVKELLIGSVGGVVTAVLGGWNLTRRDVF